LHAASYYLNPHFHYEPEFRVDDYEVKEGLYTSMKRLVKDVAERRQINYNLLIFIMLENFLQWMMQRNVGKHYFLENGGRCLGMKFQS